MAPAEDAVALPAATASRRRRGQREPLVGWGAAAFCFGNRRRERRTVPVDVDVVPGSGAADRDVVLPAATASRRRRGQREPLVGWGAAAFCFGNRRRERRTVPVDVDVVPGSGAADRDVVMSCADGNKETRKGPRVKGCCFLTPPARPSGRRKHGTMDSGSGRSTHDKQQQQLEHTKQKQLEQPRSPSSEPVPWQTQAIAGGSRSRRAEAERPRGAGGGAPAETRSIRPMSGNEEPSKGVGAFGPVVGLSVVAAVSMAGLLGGRVWAVACVCAWLAALSGLRHGQERRR